jgi:hypothetical protein
MLVRVTNACRMGCSHCLVDATPSGEHMVMETYLKVLDFICENDFKIIMISGGEPTENPDILQMIDKAKEAHLIVLLLSNGMFADNKEFTDEIIKRDILVQVTNDVRYYPKRVKEINHPKFSYEHHLRALSPHGRAANNPEFKSTRIGPECFNLRSIAHRFGDFTRAVLTLRSMNKMCTPSININGDIVAGETNSCFIFGNVINSPEQLTENLIKMRCNKCGLLDGLSIQHKLAVGEAV